MTGDYLCHHLDGEKQFRRSMLLQNPHLKQNSTASELDPAILRYHKTLPEYGVTPLHALPDIAKELGFARIFLKDESNRFALPSFKSAGASWALYRVLCKHLGLESGITQEELKNALQNHDIRIVTCSEGNWGRAVARFSKYLGLQARVYAPDNMHEYTQNLIRSEGAEVIVLEGKDYDQTLAAALEDSKRTGAILVLDIALEDLTDAPQWVTEGYSTILREVDQQVFEKTGQQKVDIATCSVGCGSWAEAITKHYKTGNSQTRVVTVEPDLAASFKESLHVGCITSLKTTKSIMNGMNCGTTSSLAWPVLRDGVDVASVVTEAESHAAVLQLKSLNINSGPCGAANLAALYRLCSDFDLGDRSKMVVVLFSSEGWREYTPPDGIGSS